MRLADFHSVAASILNQHGDPLTVLPGKTPWTAGRLSAVTGYEYTTCVRFLATSVPKNHRGMLGTRSVRRIAECILKEALKIEGPSGDGIVWKKANVLVEALLSLVDRHHQPVAPAPLKPKPISSLYTANVPAPDFFDYEWPLSKLHINALLALLYTAYGTYPLSRALRYANASNPASKVEESLRPIELERRRFTTQLNGICAPLASLLLETPAMKATRGFALRASVFLPVPHRAKSDHKLLCRIARSKELAPPDSQDTGDPTAAHITTDMNQFVVTRALLQDGVCYLRSDEALVPEGGRDHDYVPFAVSAMRFIVDHGRSGVYGVMALDAMAARSNSAQKIDRARQALKWYPSGAPWVEVALSKMCEVARTTILGAEAVNAAKQVWSVVQALDSELAKSGSVAGT